VAGGAEQRRPRRAPALSPGKDATLAAALLRRLGGGALARGRGGAGLGTCARGRRVIEAMRTEPGVVKFSFSRSSGPGGQNVNKVNTKAELRLDVDRAVAARALPPDVGDRLAATRAATAAREVVVVSQTHRTQKLNRDACEAKLAALLDAAWDAPTPRRVREGLSGAAKRARKEAKRRKGEVKARRGAARDGDW